MCIFSEYIYIKEFIIFACSKLIDKIICNKKCMIEEIFYLCKFELKYYILLKDLVSGKKIIYLDVINTIILNTEY